MPTPKKPKNHSIPKNWNEIWNKISAFRSVNAADVDSMGCCTLAEQHQPDAIQRYQILTSLQLSSQTRDPITADAIRKLQSSENGLTPISIAEMDPKVLDQLIGKVGFHNRKTVYLQKTAQILLDKYNGDIPPTVEEMLQLPGFGPKMSYLLMQEAWGENQGIGVDTHVHRIANRLGWVKATKTPEDTRKELEEWLPRNKWEPINVLLVGFGQTLCRPVGPLCSDCPVRDLCPKIGAKPSPKKKTTFNAVQDLK